MEVFHARPADVAGRTLLLVGDEHHHLARVMRLREGDALLVADGCGTMYRCTVRASGRDATECAVHERIEAMNEPRRGITLAQAVLKQPARMDWVMEKAVELGVSRILPLRSSRVVAVGEKRARWSELTRAAMKQSMRCLWPPVEEVADLQHALHRCEDTDVFLCHESAAPEHTLAAALAALDATRAVAIFIGPEGGFTDDEISYARERGASIVSLGPRRLRSETAAIAALAIVNS